MTYQKPIVVLREMSIETACCWNGPSLSAGFGPTGNGGWGAYYDVGTTNRCEVQ